MWKVLFHLVGTSWITRRIDENANAFSAKPIVAKQNVWNGLLNDEIFPRVFASIFSTAYFTAFCKQVPNEGPAWGGEIAGVVTPGPRPENFNLWRHAIWPSIAVLGRHSSVEGGCWAGKIPEARVKKARKNPDYEGMLYGQW